MPTVVLGTAGIGKTNLTTALIHDEQVKARFGARRFVVRCEAAFSALDLVANLAVATGIPPGPGARAAILAYFDEAPALVVLDDSETPWEAATSDTEEVFAQMASVTGLALVVCMRASGAPAGPRWGSADTPGTARRRAEPGSVPRHRRTSFGPPRSAESAGRNHVSDQYPPEGADWQMNLPRRCTPPPLSSTPLVS